MERATTTLGPTLIFDMACGEHSNIGLKYSNTDSENAREVMKACICENISANLAAVEK